MAIDIAASLQGRLSDPILMEWALQYYANAEKRDAADGAELCRRWFDRDTLQAWLESDDHSILNSLFVHLPASVFEPLYDVISTRWPHWRGSLAVDSAQVLAKLAPERAAELFAARGKDADSDADIDAGSLIGIIDALPILDRQQALALLKPIAVGSLDSDLADSFDAQVLAERLQLVAMPLDVATGMRIVQARLQYGADESIRILADIKPGLADYAACAELLRERRDGDSKQCFTDLAALFQPAAPLAELDRLSTQADSPLDVLPLVAEWVGDQDRQLIELLLDAIPSDLAQQCSGAVIAIMLAAVASAAGLKTLDTRPLSLNDTLTLLAADVSQVPHRDVLLDRLLEFPREQVIPVILEQFAQLQQQYGGMALVAIMGRLGWPEFSAAIIDAMSADGGDFICEQGELSLAQIGVPAQAAIIQRWDTLDYSQRIYGLAVIERVGGNAASEFLIANFDSLLEEDAEKCCTVAEHAPDERLLQLLRPHLQRHQRYINDSYYLIARLLEIDNAVVQQLSEQSHSYRKEQLARDEAAQRGEWYIPSVELEMECADCGMTNPYRVGQVVYSAEAEQQHFLLAEEHACASCQLHTDLLVTEQAKVVLATHLLGLHDGFDGNGSQLLKPRRLAHLGRSRSVGEIVEYCQSTLRQTPQDPAALIRLAICHRDGLSRPRYAQRLFEQALAAQPLAAEASLALAEALSGRGDDVEALRIMDEALALKSDWTLFVTDIVKPADHGRHFSTLYNTLVDMLNDLQQPGVKGRSRLAEDFLGVSKKVGRNDPCPCGSGRKYKKCCLLKG